MDGDEKAGPVVVGDRGALGRGYLGVPLPGEDDLDPGPAAEALGEEGGEPEREVLFEDRARAAAAPVPSPVARVQGQDELDRIGRGSPLLDPRRVLGPHRGGASSPCGGGQEPRQGGRPALSQRKSS